MFVVPPLHGHITATLAVGAQLLQRGHRVCWVAFKPIESGWIPAGGCWLVPDGIDAQQVNTILQRLDMGSRLSANDSLDFYLEEAQLPFAHMLAPLMQTVIEQENPDLIIHDESAFAGAIAAVKNNIPYVTSVTSPPGYFEKDLFNLEKQRKFIERMHEEQKKFGINSDRLIFNSDKLVLSYTSGELLKPMHGDYEFSVPIVYVGTAVAGRPEPYGFDWSQIANNDWPLVYVSVGTLLDDIREHIFKKIVAAYHDQPLTVIVNTDPALFSVWPENFYVQKKCPQLEILSKVDLLITHGGFNTLNEALYFDVPVIVLPLAWDQNFNADMVEAHKCGRKLRHRRLDAEALRATTQELLQQKQYAHNAANLGASLRAGGGALRAAQLLENSLAS